ncbi:MAG TPA: YcxB family protein [Pyrinomonadaceae bacterium]|nr:YcxB family protein [Pyrinomonadaceae bacterium]
MSANDTTSIQVDFEVNRRDLFRMNLDLAKWRILLGLAVAAIPIVGLSYFFVLIDEKKILLQLSPLFIGLPLASVGGQILRLHAICRKFVRGLPESQRRVQYRFQSETDGYDVTYGNSFSHVAWQDILKVEEKPAYFVLYLNRIEAGFVPKQGFHQSADIPVFRRILSAKLGLKAKLFPN